VDFIPDLDPIGLLESPYEGRLGWKGILGKKTYISQGDDSFNKAHYTVLRNSTMVKPYIEKHMNFVRSENPGKNEAWITRHHMETFGDWLQKKCQGDKTIRDELYLLARQPAWHVLTYKGYKINGNTFYTVSQDKKSTNQNSGVCVDATEPYENIHIYYGRIEEIWKLDYAHNFKVPLFRCQ
jgi:hypothetical protein